MCPAGPEISRISQNCISYNALHKLLGHDHLFLLGRIELVAQHGLEQGLLVVDRCLYLKC